MIYGVGHPNSIAPYHFFLVTRDGSSPGPYQILLGNLENQTFGAVHDNGAQLYTLRTSFPMHGMRSGTLALPTPFAVPSPPLQPTAP